jgi:hypothetical protein
MPEPWQGQEQPVAPRRAVAIAIQDLIAARLARGLIPLALLFLWGLARLVGLGAGEPQEIALLVGAVCAGGTMVAYGHRIVQRAFGRPESAWMSVAVWGSLIPLLFGLYVLGWRGLRAIATGGGLTGALVGIGFAWMGAWVLRSWMRVVEVERLARIMTLDLNEG